MNDELRVDGSATHYRLYDIGYAITLDRAAEVLGTSTRGRVLPSRVEARAIEIRNPPLLAALGSVDLTIGDEATPATLSAHLFDFGVCSLQMRVPAPPLMSWGEFAEFCAAMDEAAELDGAFDAALREVIGRVRPAIDRPGVAAVSEEYKIYRVDRLVVGEAPGSRGAASPIADAISDERLAALLVGERRRLSATTRRDLVPYRFSYYDDDFAALSWESALVVEPRSNDYDIEYVLEFANAQLLELRMYDQRLDADLPALYDRAEAARARRSPRLAGRFRAVLSELQTRVADITETVERVENALKVTDDVYLARIYGAALNLFRERAWRNGIDRKLSILRETYGDAQQRSPGGARRAPGNRDCPADCDRAGARSTSSRAVRRGRAIRRREGAGGTGTITSCA